MLHHTQAPGARRAMKEATSAFAAGNWQHCTRLIDAYRDAIWRRTVAATTCSPRDEGPSECRLRMQKAEELWQAMPAEVRARMEHAPGDGRPGGLRSLRVTGYTEEGDACVPLGDYAAAMGVSPQEALAALADSDRLVPHERILSIH